MSPDFGKVTYKIIYLYFGVFITRCVSVKW